MPSKAASICAEPGCAEIALAGQGYCARHQKRTKPWSHGTGNRPSASRRGYGVAWRKIRAAYLAEHPACALCGRPATDVDHVVPKRFGGSDDDTNLQALCKECHQRKTARGL